MELSGRVDLDLSGVTVALERTSPEIADAVRRDWAAFVAKPARRPFLRCRFGALGVGAPPGPLLPKRMRSTLCRAGAIFELPEGRAEVRDGGEARIDLASGLGRREFWTAMSLLRACLAWRLPDRGAALIHAAGAAVDGRGYLLVGPGGAGKTSWVTLVERCGGRALSDDLVLVEAGAGRIDLLGAPFRSTHVADYRPGRFELAAVLFPRQGSPAAWSRAPGLLARARILANLPFVSDAPVEDGRLEPLIAALAERVPCLDFTFALDTSFVELLRRGPG